MRVRHAAIAIPVAAIAVVAAFTALLPAAPATAAPVALAEGLTLTEHRLDGPAHVQVLTADLATPGLEAVYLNPGTISSTARLSEQATRAGAVAAVNGDFFDLGHTDAPHGTGIRDGVLLHARAKGWNDTAVIGTDHRGRIERVRLDATITLPAGTFPASNLNSGNVAPGGIGVYTPEWGEADLGETVTGAEGVRAVRLRDGAVVETAADAKGTRPGTDTVLIGREAGATTLAALAVGDPVTVAVAPPAGTTAISGNAVILRDGETVAPDGYSPDPRTAVGFSADGARMWLATVDGRSDASVGLTYIDLAGFLAGLGADDALSLDGGGSSTMVARLPGADGFSVRNHPSMGYEREIPNGIGFRTTDNQER
ncbi:phosphodiester glycosidase family protein [Phytomonospora sp. NPDC050363]|uniref:phosphodiester glycosidase family protein n=1 Tax=Phytomonospora sp. NPDC050363 TaxID=3155642 RepID=UPI0033FDA5AC